METLAYSLAVPPLPFRYQYIGCRQVHSIYLHEMTSIKMLSSHYSVSYSYDICYLYGQGHWGNIAARQTM
jgi:hypothetical protein